MDMGEALYRAISHRSPATEVATFGGAIEYLLGKSGGVAAAAARLAGVPATTFRGWLRGRQPKSDRAGAVVGAALRAQRRDRLPRGREKRLRAAGSMADVQVTATYRYTGEKEREIDLGQYLDDSLGNELIDAYLAGDSLEGLAETFAMHISGAPFYEQEFGPDPDYGFDVSGLTGWGAGESLDE